MWPSQYWRPQGFNPGAVLLPLDAEAGELDRGDERGAGTCDGLRPDKLR